MPQNYPAAELTVKIEHGMQTDFPQLHGFLLRRPVHLRWQLAHLQRQIGASAQTDLDCSFLGFDIDHRQVVLALALHENDVFAKWGSSIKSVQQCPSIIWQVNNPNNFDRIARILRANG